MNFDQRMFTPQKKTWRDKSYYTPQNNISQKYQYQDNFNYFEGITKQNSLDETIKKINQQIQEEKLKIIQLEIMLKNVQYNILFRNSGTYYKHYSGQIFQDVLSRKPFSSNNNYFDKYQSRSQQRNQREESKTETKIKPETNIFDNQFTPEKSKQNKFYEQLNSFTQPKSNTQKKYDQFSKEPKNQQSEDKYNQFDVIIKKQEQLSDIQSKVRGKKQEFKDQLQILKKINEMIIERKSYQPQKQEQQFIEENQPQDQNQMIEQNEQIQPENKNEIYIEEERKSNIQEQEQYQSEKDESQVDQQELEQEQQQSEKDENQVDQENIVKQYQPNENRLQIVFQTIQQLYEASGVNNRGIELQYKYFVQYRQDKIELFSNYDIRQLALKKKLQNICDSIQKVRGDGNCFYTAFGFQFLELILLDFSDKEYQDFINWINQINLRFKIICKQFSIDDPQLESQLREHFLFLLQELRFTENEQRKIDLLEKFREFEIEPNGNGCFYPLSTIFFRNLSDYLLEFCEQKDAVYDRINLITWEEECDNNELIISNLAEQLKLRIKLLFFDDGNYALREYGDEQHSQIILLIRPGHYNIGKKQN